MGYTAEDENLIKEKWDDLLLSCTKICKNDEDWNFIKRAFFLAKEAHEGVRRRSGEPYLLHPIAVAKIVIEEIGLGVKSVVAALLHDVVEDTEYSVEDMERIFGPKIASMVDGLTKMSGVFNADTSEQAEYFRKVLLTLSDDVRVILIKIADRLHNMRTLGAMPMNKQIKITGETIYLFAPLAYRLGLYSIKSELEDLCMKYRFPQQYAEITQKLQESEASRREFINKFNAPIIASLNRDNINYEISGRVKSVYSIWSKMQRKQIPFEEIYDLFAIRIVFKPLPFPSEKTQCWQIYSTITDIYTPKPDRLRDWISMPKANGYEALHSTVMGPDGVWVEVQIRTQRMEDIAERGFAAHWKYKHATISQDEDEFDKWLKQIRAALNSPTENAVDFLDNFKLSLYTSEIVVFTPKGEARKMPFGATALDFAYDIHSKIGNSAISAKINHKLEPITTQINSGDQIEIITADNARPKPEWLETVTTAKAKQSIKSFLKRERQNNIERGMQMLDEKMKSLNVKLSGRVLRKITPIYDSKNKEELRSEGNRLARQPGQSPQGQLQEQDTQILDPLHPPEEGGRDGRCRNSGRNRPGRGGSGHGTAVRNRGVLQAHSGRQGGRVSRPRLGKHHRTQGHVRRAEPSCDTVRPQHRQGGDQMVAAQGHVLPGDHGTARHRPAGHPARPGEGRKRRFQHQYPRSEHPQPRRHLRRQRQPLREGRRKSPRRDGQTAQDKGYRECQTNIELKTWMISQR